MTLACNDFKSKLVSPPVFAFPEFNEPFVMETDASSVALGAVLAQEKEDGKIHPVQYASRTMNASERNYSACERDVVLWVLRVHTRNTKLTTTRDLVGEQVHEKLVQGKGVARESKNGGDCMGNQDPTEQGHAGECEA